MNIIPTEQNSPPFMRLMRARSRIYQLAGYYQKAQLAVVLIVPVIGAIIGLNHAPWRAHVAAIALLAALLDVLWLDRMQRTQLKLAARIAESFDCRLFGLPWNEFIAGKRPDPMIVTEAERAWKRGDAKLLDWYQPAELAQAPLHLARLICQQTNLWYDSRLRRRVGAALVTVAALLTIGLGIAGVVLSLDFPDFVLAVVAPASPVLVWTTREYYRQRDTAEALETVKANADALWVKAVRADCDDAECMVRAREFQDAIFTRRAASPLNIPFVYELMRTTMEANMAAGNREFLAEIGIATSD